MAISVCDTVTRAACKKRYEIGPRTNASPNDRTIAAADYNNDRTKTAIVKLRSDNTIIRAHASDDV